MDKKTGDWGEWLLGVGIFAVYLLILEWFESHDSWETLFGSEKMPEPFHSLGFSLLLFGLFGFLFVFIMMLGKRKVNREKDEKEKFKKLFLHLPICVFVVDKQSGVVLEANPKVFDVYGTPSVSAVGKTLPDIFSEHPVSHQLFRHETLRGSPLFVKHGTYDSSWGNKEVVIHLIEDVSSLYERESETRCLAMAVRRASDAVFMTDIKGKISYVNPAYEHLTGRKASDVIGRDFFDFRPEGVSRKDFEEYGRRLKNGESLRVPFDLVHPNGSRRHVISVTTPVIDDSGEIEGFVTTEQDVTAEREMSEYFRLQAEQDELTGLMKRTPFVKMMMDEKGSSKSLYLCDLDGFKEINDVLGHDMGDMVLKRVSDRLGEILGGKNRVCRLGGDEFMVLQRPDDDREIGLEILDSFMFPFPVDDYELSVGISIGQVPMSESPDPEKLIKMADMAMYKAKRMGKNRICRYSDEMRGVMSRRVMLEQELKLALKEENLKLFYQPQFDLLSGKISGVEALLRWEHPTHGWISPVEFIPVAERSKLIVDIGVWAFRESCRQMKEWLDAGIAPPTMSVNMSVMHIIQDSVPETLLAILEEEGVDPEIICVEMTESLMMTPKDSTLRTLEDIRLIGMEIALDDFGTGYSSLSYLKEFPIDKIKIDKNFIQGIFDGVHDAVIVESVIRMSKGMGLKVIAEGVETKEQLDFLMKAGCDEMQGFFGGKPMPSSVFMEWMKNTKGVIG